MSRYDETTLRMALVGLESEKKAIERMIGQVFLMLPHEVIPSQSPRKHVFSAAHRRALSRAQKKRWRAK
jgi:hypothetical protein